MIVVNCVLLTTVVEWAEPFHATAAPERKPVPFTVRVKELPPAVAVAGDNEVRVGGGLAMVKATAFEAPPPGEGLTTVTALELGDAMSAAVMLAVNCVEFTNVVVRAAPSHCTIAPETKLLPVTVRVNAALPATAVAGLREVIVGTGFGGTLIVKEDAAEVFPLLTTVICAVPEVAISAAAMLAVNWVAFTKLLVRADPFHCTVAPFENPEPLTVSVNAADPALTLPGESEEIEGTGDPSLHPIRLAREETKSTDRTKPRRRRGNINSGPRKLNWAHAPTVRRSGFTCL